MMVDWFWLIVGSFIGADAMAYYVARHWMERPWYWWVPGSGFVMLYLARKG